MVIFQNLLSHRICVRCAGRVYARVGSDLDNSTRGSIIEFLISVLDKPGFRFESEDNCEICGGIFKDLGRFFNMASDLTQGYEYDTFLVGSTFDDKTVALESSVQKGAEAHSETIKKEFNRELGKLISSRTGKEFEKNDPDVALQFNLKYDSLKLQIKSLYIYGVYRKFRRDTPQTRWIHKEYNQSKSLEELIGEPLIRFSNATDFRLHGAGREDVDVRMLGNGREFVIEGMNPKVRKIDLEKYKQEVNRNSDILEILNLEFTDKKAVKSLKESSYTKTYLARISSIETIDAVKLQTSLDKFTGKVIYQRTPLRVSGRRSDLVRARTVEEVRVLEVNGKQASLEIRAQAGTYIKELVNGDEGRTSPSISEIYGAPLKVEELDVIKIHRGEK